MKKDSKKSVVSTTNNKPIPPALVVQRFDPAVDVARRTLGMIQTMRWSVTGEETRERHINMGVDALTIHHICYLVDLLQDELTSFIQDSISGSVAAVESEVAREKSTAIVSTFDALNRVGSGR